MRKSVTQGEYISHSDLEICSLRTEKSAGNPYLAGSCPVPGSKLFPAVPYFLSAAVQRATSSGLMLPTGRTRASRNDPPSTSPRYCDQESSVP